MRHFDAEFVSALRISLVEQSAKLIEVQQQTLQIIKATDSQPAAKSALEIELLGATNATAFAPPPLPGQHQPGQFSDSDKDPSRSTLYHAETTMQLLEDLTLNDSNSPIASAAIDAARTVTGGTASSSASTPAPFSKVDVRDMYHQKIISPDPDARYDAPTQPFRTPAEVQEHDRLIEQDLVNDFVNEQLQQFRARSVGRVIPEQEIHARRQQWEAQIKHRLAQVRQFPADLQSPMQPTAQAASQLYRIDTPTDDSAAAIFVGRHAEKVSKWSRLGSGNNSTAIPAHSPEEAESEEDHELAALLPPLHAVEESKSKSASASASNKRQRKPASRAPLKSSLSSTLFPAFFTEPLPPIDRAAIGKYCFFVFPADYSTMLVYLFVCLYAPRVSSCGWYGCRTRHPSSGCGAASGTIEIGWFVCTVSTNTDHLARTVCRHSERWLPSSCCSK